MPRFTTREHWLAVLSVLFISLCFHGLFTLNEGIGTARASAVTVSAGYDTILLPPGLR